ncbi:transposase [Aphelenchoides avenae]|nr:transposase [Aphelenchus avenae]
MSSKSKDLLQELKFFQYDGPDHAFCLLCQRRLRLSRLGGSTTNLKNHLARKHPEKKAVLEATKKRRAEEASATAPSVKRFFSASAPTSNATACGSQHTTASETSETTTASQSTTSSQPGSGRQEKVFRYFDRKVADRSLAKLIDGANLPFSLVDNKHYRAFVASLNPEYKVPSRSTLTERLDSYCEEVESKIKGNLAKKKSILSLTVHFIGEKGVPAFHTAAVLPLKCRHEGELLAPEFRNLLNHHDLRNDKIHVLLRDAASNMKKMAGILGLTGLDCFGHKLPDGLEQLPSLTSLIEKAKKIIRKLRKSGVELHRFERLRDELGLPHYVFIKNADIRWNSAFEMLKRLLVLRPAVEQLIASSDAYPQISADESGMARMVVELLQPNLQRLEDRPTIAANPLPQSFRFTSRSSG